MRIGYIFASSPEAAFTCASSVHISEMCAALAELGNQVRLFAPNAAECNPLQKPFHTEDVQVSLTVIERIARRRSGTGHMSQSAAAGHGRGDWKCLLRDAAWLSLSSSRDRNFYSRARKLLARNPPDVLYERYVFGMLAGSRLAREFRVPLLLEMNASATFPEEWWHGHSRAYVSLMRRYERRLADAATHVFVVSARMRTYLLELGIAPEKVILLPNAADPKRFIPEHRDAGAIRAQFRLQDKVVVGFAGAFRRFHDVDIVLNAAAMLQHTETQVHILLVGEGPSSDRLQSRVREEGLSSMVTFAGRIPHEQMPAFVGAMDVTLAPAPALEEFHFSPLKIFEYMGAAKPVIASRIGEIETIIREGENGLLVAPGDVEQLCAAIRRLVRDPAMRERLGRAARRDIETKHNWTRNAAAVVDVANQSLNRDLKFWQRGSTKARATQLRADLSE